jgi:uncharacterized membrane protein HdeD (DUF308 family)
VANRARLAPHLTLSRDETRHLMVVALAILTLVFGLASFLLGMLARNAPSASPAIHVTATAAGVVAVGLGMLMQMFSATRNERIVIVTGIIGGFVGACLGLANGGFSS